MFVSYMKLNVDLKMCIITVNYNIITAKNILSFNLYFYYFMIEN